MGLLAPLPGHGTDRPNFVLIVADDLGYGDLGCYGSRVVRSPHIDRLAAEGLRFTDFHSNGSMCSPTRAALLTGLYQHRFGPHLEGPLDPQGDGDTGLPPQARTLAEALLPAGYVTGIFGKWHLGFRAPFLPTDQGFDEFRGLLTGDGDHHSHIDRYGSPDWWHNDQLQSEEGYTADLITRHSVRFIEQHRSQPFFLYVPHLGIHFPWQGPDDPAHRVVGKNYEDDKWGIVPDPDNVSPHVQAMVEAVDRSVGAIVEALKRAEVASKTLVVFVSDNGGYLNYGQSHRNISSNGPLRGQKGELFEGGHRVPAIAWWPGRIQPGTCHQTVMTFDLFPTLLKLAGQDVPRVDGIDLAPLLFENQPLPERTLFWRKPRHQAVRRGPWKLVRLEDQPPALFNLADDLGEQRERAADHADVVEVLMTALAAWEKQVDAPRQPQGSIRSN